MMKEKMLKRWQIANAIEREWAGDVIHCLAAIKEL